MKYSDYTTKVWAINEYTEIWFKMDLMWQSHLLLLIVSLRKDWKEKRS